MAESTEDSTLTDLRPSFSDSKEENNATDCPESTVTQPEKIVEKFEDISNRETNGDNFTRPNTFAVPQLSLSFSHPKKSKSKDGKVKEGSSVETSHKNTKPTSYDNSQNHTMYENYTEPEWGGEAKDNFSFDVLKNGTIINNIPLNDKSYFIFGRLPSCDVTLEHPSLSRYHAVIQYSKTATQTHEKGWYVYDLDSTHGTWVNKKKVNPKVYHRIKVGHIVKFGGSSRLHILQGPQDDADEESELTITEMKEQSEKQKREAELLILNEKQQQEERAEKERRLLADRGCGWGMSEDAEDVAEDNPFALQAPENENLYIDDPKKALKGFYEREGLDLPDYQFTDASAGSHKCTLEIPMDGPNGEELIAEAVVSGKKKEAVVACALEACRMLDKLGMLRSSTHEKKKKKERNWEDNDYYDSDEDTFLDRTGTIEKKRTMRMKKAGKESAETYESLMIKYNKATERIQEIEMKLEKAKADSEALANEEMDELEAYMVSIKSGMMDSKTRLQLKGELLRLRMEEQSLRRLVNIAKPASLPPLKPISIKSTEKVSTAEKLSNKLQKLAKKPLPVKKTVLEMKSDEYDEDDEDDDAMESGDHDRNVISTPAPHEVHKKEKNTKEKSLERISPGKSGSENEDINVKRKRPQIAPASLNEQEEKPKQKRPSQYFSTSAALETMDKKSAKAEPQSQTQIDLDTLDPKFATWLPPAEQTGDGRTSLNDKLGY